MTTRQSTPIIVQKRGRKWAVLTKGKRTYRLCGSFLEATELAESMARNRGCEVVVERE